MPTFQNGPYRHFVPRQQPMFHRVFRAEVPAVRLALIELRCRFLNEVNTDTIGRLELAMAEILNNICEHGGISLSLSAAALPPRANQGQDPLLPRHLAPVDVPTVHLSVIRQHNSLACAVTDDGIALPEDCLSSFTEHGFSPYRSRERQDAILPEGGFGWFLIQDLTRAMCYYREDQRNFLAFTIPFHDSQSAA